jgi:hypothetical protein
MYRLVVLHVKTTCAEPALAPVRVTLIFHWSAEDSRPAAGSWQVSRLCTVAAGIIGAGTNNARLAGLLRALSAYYAKEPQLLFLVRVAQGLVHMGKGLLTLSPHHAHGQLLSGGFDNARPRCMHLTGQVLRLLQNRRCACVLFSCCSSCCAWSDMHHKVASCPLARSATGPALGGILAVLTAALDMKATISGKQHSLLYFLAAAMQPRMLLTIDEQGTAHVCQRRARKQCCGISAGTARRITEVDARVYIC